MLVGPDLYRPRNRQLFMNAMKLKSVKYAEFLGRDKEWSLDELSLGDINLIVGLNATGKTRTLNLINSFSKMLLPAGNFRPIDGSYDHSFDVNGRLYRYNVTMEQSKVIAEHLYFAPNDLLNRGLSGEGFIYAEEEKKIFALSPPRTSWL